MQIAINMHKTNLPLWRITGTSPCYGMPVTIKVRADDYADAVAKANKTKMIIRDVVMIEG